MSTLRLELVDSTKWNVAGIYVKSECWWVFTLVRRKTSVTEETYLCDEVYVVWKLNSQTWLDAYLVSIATALAVTAVTDCTFYEEVNQLGFYGCVTYVRSYSKCCRFTYRRKLANFALLDTNLETCFRNRFQASRCKLSCCHHHRSCCWKYQLYHRCKPVR